MSKKMAAILLHLGSNMWGKIGHKDHYLINEQDGDGYWDPLHCDRETWRKIIDFLPTVGINTVLIDMGEAVEMKRHPEIAVEGTWSQEEFRAELARMRGLGLTPLPKFNFSLGHNAWMKDMVYRVDTPEFYTFCKDIIEETIELFDHPAFFHLGLEEEDPEMQKNQPISISRSPERLAYDAKFLFDCCRAGGARPWIWVDPRSIERGWGGEERFCKAVPTDVLCSNWYYGYQIRVGDTEERLYENPHVSLYKKLEEWGYDQVPTGSTWSYYNNNRLTAHFVHDYLDPAHVTGLMTAPWLFTVPRLLYGLMFDAQCLGEAIKTYPLNK